MGKAPNDYPRAQRNWALSALPMQPLGLDGWGILLLKTANNLAQGRHLWPIQ